MEHALRELKEISEGLDKLNIRLRIVIYIVIINFGIGLLYMSYRLWGG